ncbi:MAG: TlpA family protein disulfide reductase [Flavobacterium sp.]
MTALPNIRSSKTFLLSIALFSIFSFSSCSEKYGKKDFTAYFGGEVQNPQNPYVLLYKDTKVIDTLKLNENNRFFKKFDSLAPGLYSFVHEPEYQYVYFEKNDSILVSINAQDFDESIVFTGRGEQKNNFLMEMYLRNQRDWDNLLNVMDYNLVQFEKAVEDVHVKNVKYYQDKKAYIKWSENFDIFAKAALDMPYYSKKEVYPIIHQLRTGKDVVEQLPKNYYGYRKDIDFNNVLLSAYSPFVKYLSYMLNNMAVINYHNHFSDADLSLKTNINKMNIADTLIQNEKVKNTIFNNIAFTYLLEDQNMAKNQKFMEVYHRYSTDRSQKNEITKIGSAIQLLKTNQILPEVKLRSVDGKIISSNTFPKGKTVIFFWTDNAQNHMMQAHKKVIDLKKKYPAYNFIGVNLDKNPEKWAKIIEKNKFQDVTELQCVNFDDLKYKWAITKIHRTIILDQNGNIKNAFTNLFNNDIEEYLK